MDQNNVFAELTAFTALPRLTGLALSPDGTRLVATMQQPDEKGARYTSSIWQIPLEGTSPPTRLTRSDKGETSPAFLPDGSLLFVSVRADPDAGKDADPNAEDEPALWLLPPSGEPQLYAYRPGGLGLAAVARDRAVVVAAGRQLAWTPNAAGADAQRRSTRKDRKISAILHTGMPIRHWDHELGDESPRLVRIDPADDGTHERDLTPLAGQALHETSASLDAGGTTLVTSWRTRRPGGRFDYTLVRIDPASGAHRVLVDEPGASFHGPKLAPDGSVLAVLRHTDGSYDEVFEHRLQLRALRGKGAVRELDLGDVMPNEWTFSADGATLFVAGDLHGRGAVLAVDVRSGEVVSSLATDASYSSLCPSPDGRYVYALRSAIDEAPTPVRLDTSAEHQVPRRLATPAPTPELPGTLVELSVPAGDGRRVHAWLCLPPEGERPAPLMLWIHGGPFSSYNSWSWRWSPWTAVARGYAVLMPDPALSTGYGMDWIARAWPHRAGLVWRDLETVLDAVEQRPEIDASRTACLGASFGGYMTNWVAGHTERFDAIVTHAGLWALDQQHTTTDGAQWKTGIFGTPEDHPDWYAENSPHNFIDKITTPMLIVHGNRDYRVPISEALRLWWDLARYYPGDPDSMPHRFLQLTGENHWVLSPANAQIWYETVLGFCDQHVRGVPFTPSSLL
ncbi:MAG TPA: prolyl oligopeptidase family serine peptidase [Jatrophihabitantaceae bacterium]|nr:prolyl oligopeptidase family serine peptidase [Jatrophihabitantaceae bacterium]